MEIDNQIFAFNPTLVQFKLPGEMLGEVASKVLSILP